MKKMSNKELILMLLTLLLSIVMVIFLFFYVSENLFKIPVSKPLLVIEPEEEEDNKYLIHNNALIKERKLKLEKERIKGLNGSHFSGMVLTELDYNGYITKVIKNNIEYLILIDFIYLNEEAKPFYKELFYSVSNKDIKRLKEGAQLNIHYDSDINIIRISLFNEIVEQKRPKQNKSEKIEKNDEIENIESFEVLEDEDNDFYYDFENDGITTKIKDNDFPKNENMEME